MWRNKVKKLMDTKKMSQKDLAKKSGITEASISRYLSGESEPRIDILLNLSKALEVDASYLITTACEDYSAFEEISTAIARKGDELSPEEANKLILLILQSQKNV